eukprot:GABU01001720.1.p2 GENE.GABU01001720.1~~GABU01001720.1.p2  ORF type:complete len:137 (-),score=53.16 GABU01001720.1:15-389(-)
MMMYTKTIPIKTIEEISFEYVFMDNLKLPSVMAYLSQMKKLKNLRLSFNNMVEYLELVKFEIFSNLVTITIENNPISDNCKYLRQFVTYRFSSVRYFNKTPIDYADLQKAKQVFSVFDKILQIP